MKKLLILSFILSLSITCFGKIDLNKADSMIRKAEDLKGCENVLLEQLKNAENNTEKCEVLWRLSKVNLLIGENITEKEEKRGYYSKGKDYAEEAIKADPKNANAYMWHSANVGRESQTKGLKDQIAIVPIVTEDLTTILDKLGKTEISEAWQAISEMYYKHPFKSNDTAINYGRKAIMCIPADETRLGSYAFFAEMLYSRGNSASKRKSEIDENAEEFKKSNGSNIDKYSYFEGSLGSGYTPKWSTKNLGSMSDKEEALDIINYAIGIYQKNTSKTIQDNRDYKLLVSYKEKWH